MYVCSGWVWCQAGSLFQWDKEWQPLGSIEYSLGGEGIPEGAMGQDRALGLGAVAIDCVAGRLVLGTRDNQLYEVCRGGGLLPCPSKPP